VATVSTTRTDLFPVGTSVGVYPSGSAVPGAGAQGTAIASATVDAAGALSITNAGVVDHTPYVLYASVNGQHRTLNVRSTTSGFTAGDPWRPRLKARRTAIGTTLPGSP
jgi:hypothetical protein